MTQRKKRKLGQIDQQISVCKANLSLSEGKIIGSLARGSPATTLADSRLSTPPRQAPPGKDSDEAVLFIKHLTKLRDVLQEKNAIMESQYDRTIAVLESDLSRVRKQLQAAQRWQGIAQRREQQSRGLRRRVEELQAELRTKLEAQNQQLKHYRQENVDIKLQNRSLRADNKVIMTHIDRLTKEIKECPPSKITPLEERELRVMRSLYHDSLPSLELRESQRHMAQLEEPRYRMAAEDAAERNGELKGLVRRLNEEAELLRREKELLMEQNRQKHLNLQNQKQLVAMAAEEKARMDGLIKKMGDKIMTLQEINQTLRDAQTKEDTTEAEQNYYRTSRTKAGQFYYRK